ncbi:MAG: sulfur transferase domain-containing protein, partial [Myxococcota bacterium]
MLGILNETHPAENLITAGQPTLEQIQAAAAAGVKTIITLRPDSELGDRDERAEVEAAGMAYVSIPISGPGDLNAANAQALAEALSDDGTTLVHCGSSNRVGALLAVKAAVIDGQGTEDAISLGKAAGLTSMEPMVRQALS